MSIKKLINIAGFIGIGYTINDIYKNRITIPKRTPYQGTSIHYFPKETEYSISKTIKKIICEKLEYIFTVRLPSDHVNRNKFIFYYDTKDDAKLILNRLKEEANNYGFVSCYDYSLLNGAINNTSSNWESYSCGWSWDDLCACTIQMNSNGKWYINLPYPHYGILFNKTYVSNSKGVTK